MLGHACQCYYDFGVSSPTSRLPRDTAILDLSQASNWSLGLRVFRP